MAESLATKDDVANVMLRPLSTPEENAAGALLLMAWHRLALLVPTLTKRIDARTLDQAVVTGVQAEMVANVFKNPTSARTQQRSFTLDDYSEQNTDTLDNAISSGQLFPTEQHLRMLAPTKRGAFTVMPS